MIQPIARTMASTSRDVPGRKKQMMPAMTVSAPRIPDTARAHPGNSFSVTAATMRISPAAMSCSPNTRATTNRVACGQIRATRPKTRQITPRAMRRPLGSLEVSAVESDMS